jgi:hypothetical protein
MQIDFAELDLDNACEEAFRMPPQVTYIDITEHLSQVKAGSR